LEAELDAKDAALLEAANTLMLARFGLDLATDALRDAQSKEAAYELYISVLQQRIRSLEAQAQPRVYVTSLYI
jgi:hypothetical protein